MENRIEVSNGTEIPRKSRSLDVKSLYKSRSGKEGENQSLKRKGSEEDDGEKKKKKKSRKEASLSSLTNVNSSSSSKKSIDKAYHRGLNSGSHDSEGLKSGSSQKLDSSSGLNGVSQLSLDDSGIRIPRRKRGLVGRKKIEGGQVLKLSDESAGKASIEDQNHQTAKLSGDDLGAQAEAGKAKRNKGLEENINSELDAGSHAKKENALESLSVVSNGNSSLQKSRRNRRKRKDLTPDGKTDSKEAEPLVNTKACRDSQEDEEENLEENAARMLSSRFDPSCTGFSLNTKASAMQSSNGLSNPSSPGQDFDSHMSKSFSGSESPSVDNAGRVLRPRARKQHKEKKGTRKRRHFYEIFFGDLDACWVLNRRIKVFWPLDQSWYYGLVNNYDKEKMLHHIRYDDREEEWIDLQHERFKLLLLPTEVPRKAKQKKSIMQITSSEEKEGNLKPWKEKKKRDLMLEDDSCIGSCMDSEPIISWLARSTHRIKSPNSVKKQKTSGLSPKSVPTLSDSAGSLHGCLGDVSSRRDTNKLSCNSGRSSDAGREEKFSPEDNPEDSKMPIVYYRKRLRKTGSVLSQIYRDEHASMYGHHYCTSISPVEEIWELEEPDDFVVVSDRSWPLWYTDDAGLLKLTLPWIESGKVIFKCLPLHSLVNDSLGVELLRFFHAVMLLRHGILVITWPKVRLEMLFVDNVVGLRFLLFEGCLKRAVVLVSFILTLFHHPNDQGKLTDFQLPATSIRFKVSCVQHLGKQLVFALYNFRQVENSVWMYLDNKLRSHCLLTKKLPLSECTYDNIQALQNGINQSPFMSLCGQASSVKGTRKRSRQGINFLCSSREVSLVNISSATHSDELHRKLPPLALSFTAAPTFFVNLHLKLLMEHRVADICFQDHDSEITQNNLKAPANVAPSGGSCTKLVTETSLSICSHQGRLKSSQLYENCVVNVAETSSGTAAGRDKPYTSSRSIVNRLTVEIPSFDQFEKPLEKEVQSAQQPMNFSLSMNGSIIPSPSLTAPISTGQRNRNSMSSFGNLSHPWSDGKANVFQNGFGNGLKKPRTQVSYTLPCGGFDVSSKQRNVQKGLPNKRIRRASEKRSSDISRGSRRNLELLSCEANVLISASDRGWRECGARVVLELFDNNEWRLAVKLSGTTKYSYKAHQFLQPGSTNRYTHVMMWKGGKDWILEFPDRSQWALFKEMHEECYNRNLRSASVKNIPIPGVRLVEDIDDNGTEIAFLRSSTKYFQQMKTDVEMALDPSRVMYDMDSDDERWISKFQNSSEFDKSSSIEIGEEMFEKTMDMFEKAAYVRQCDQFTSDEIEELMTGVGPMDLIKTIYEHWRQKRLRKGMPLIRHLQPPSWETYQKQVRQWEQAVTKMNTTHANGGREKAAPVEKPLMYAFCLKPRGLEVPNKGSKQRSQKKFSISAHTNAVLGDQDGFHPMGRRSNGFAFGDERIAYSGHNYESLDDSPLSQSSPRVFSPRDAANMYMNSDDFERNRLHRIDRSKSKKYRAITSPVDSQMVSPYSHRVVQNRNGVHRGNNFPEWSSQLYYQPDVAQRLVNAHGFDHDEFRLLEASGAAQHAHNIAKRKRENARRLFYRADLAMHKAVVALMTAEAIKASSEDYDYDYDSESDSFSVSDSDIDSDREE